MNIPQGWTDDGTTLTAPNGHKVVAGFRSYILQNGLGNLGLPLEDEHSANPVEEYWLQTPADGTRQLFNGGELAYTSKRGAYLVGIGNELRGARADRDKARSDLASAQQQLANALKAIVALQQQIQVLQDGSQVNDLKTRLQQIKSLASI
jgi:hypothetical protein